MCELFFSNLIPQYLTSSFLPVNFGQVMWSSPTQGGGVWHSLIRSKLKFNQKPKKQTIRSSLALLYTQIVVWKPQRPPMDLGFFYGHKKGPIKMMRPPQQQNNGIPHCTFIWLIDTPKHPPRSPRSSITHWSHGGTTALVFAHI